MPEPITTPLYNFLRAQLPSACTRKERQAFYRITDSNPIALEQLSSTVFMISNTLAFKTINLLRRLLKNFV